MKIKYFLFLLSIIACNYTFSQKNLPDVNLTSLEGKSVRIVDEISDEKITVLSFWATWCIPCINELDAISDVYPDWQEETNVEVIAISIDDSRTQKRVRPLVNGKGWEYKILLDKNQQLKRALNITLVPYTVILKGDKILHKYSGYTPGSESKLLDLVKKFSK